jgi:hypothetical protein
MREKMRKKNTTKVFLLNKFIVISTIENDIIFIYRLQSLDTVFIHEFRDLKCYKDKNRLSYMSVVTILQIGLFVMDFLKKKYEDFIAGVNRF